MKNAERESDANQAARRGRDIADRTFQFAKRVVAVARAMPRDPAAATIARQVIRSGTSVGANVEEAEAAHSKAEFIQKVNLARKEARETLYWLRLIGDCGMLRTSRLRNLIAEANEIVCILTAIVRNARKIS
ncbi:MAG: four helix bundle protein [Phycisphaerae bacterium]